MIGINRHTKKILTMVGIFFACSTVTSPLELNTPKKASKIAIKIYVRSIKKYLDKINFIFPQVLNLSPFTFPLYIKSKICFII